jgi:hypothetical protein
LSDVLASILGVAIALLVLSPVGYALWRGRGAPMLEVVGAEAWRRSLVVGVVGAALMLVVVLLLA